MRNSILIDADGIVLNALASPSGNRLIPSPGQTVIDLSSAFDISHVVGYRWDGESLIAPPVVVPPPAPVPTLEEIRGQKWEAIKTERDWRKENGVKVGANWFHSDVFSRTQQIGLVMMGVSIPAVPWKTMDGNFVTMSQTLANQIFQAVAASDMAIFAAAETKRAAMLALSDPSSFDVTVGWPETHQ